MAVSFALLLAITTNSKLPCTNCWGFTMEPTKLQLHPKWKTVVPHWAMHLHTGCPHAFSYSGTAGRSLALVTQPHTAGRTGCWLNAYPKSHLLPRKKAIGRTQLPHQLAHADLTHPLLWDRIKVTYPTLPKPQRLLRTDGWCSTAEAVGTYWRTSNP